jgi:hypothetical protein
MSGNEAWKCSQLKNDWRTEGQPEELTTTTATVPKTTMLLAAPIRSDRRR